jgi:bacillithiol system protein YtxJ
MAAIEQVSDMARWEELWTEAAAPDAKRLLVFKRSPICPTSFAAEAEFNQYVAALNDKTIHVISVDVIAARPISQRIASDTGTQHESPQALLVGPGRAVLWNASHYAIEKNSLSKAVGGGAPVAKR